MEYLQAHPQSRWAGDARNELANALGRAKALAIIVSSTGRTECKSFSLSQYALIPNLRVLGSSWNYYCPKSATFKWTFRNPTKAPLTVKAQALGQNFEFSCAADSTASGTVSVPDGCTSTGQLRDPPSYSRGAVTFGCSNSAFITGAALGPGAR